MPTQIRISLNKYSNVSNLKRKSSSSTVVDYTITACALLRKTEIVCMNRK